MSGIREKKKQINKQQIIQAAEEVFLQYGYENTTMEAIAEKAMVGTGTVYNYFHSKANLFVRVVLGEEIDFSITDETITEYLTNAAHPLDAMTKLLEAGMETFHYVSKELWNEIIKAVMSDSTEGEYLKTQFLRFDQEFILNFKNILIYYKSKGLLAANFDEEYGARSIYNTVIAETITYLFQEKMTFKDYQASVRKSIAFIFQEYLKTSEKG